MRRSLLALAALLSTACGGSEPPAEEPQAPPPSRIEAGVHTARTAEADIQAAQRQAQARIDSQMQAVMDTGAAP